MYGNKFLIYGCVQERVWEESILWQLRSPRSPARLRGEVRTTDCLPFYHITSAGLGSLMAAVFAMQGVGSLISVFVVIACLCLNLSAAFTWR